MAATKSNTQLVNAVSVAAGTTFPTNTTDVSCTTSYGGEVNVRITNGATGPTIGLQVQLQVSEDNTKWYNFAGLMYGGVTASEVDSWSVDIPIGVMYVRAQYGANTGQAVTLDIDVSLVTGI